MKKIIAVALLSALFAVPTFADDTTAKPPAKKPAVATPPAHKHIHKKMADAKDDCDSVHDMQYHHPMMGGAGDDMATEPGLHGLDAVGLSKEQEAQVTKLSDDLKHNNWIAQGLINDETVKLRDLYAADKRDPAAIGQEYQKIFDLKRQMIEGYLDTQNRIDEVLTPEQRAKMKDDCNSVHQMHHPM